MKEVLGRNRDIQLQERRKTIEKFISYFKYNYVEL